MALKLNMPHHLSPKLPQKSRKQEIIFKDRTSFTFPPKPQNTTEESLAIQQSAALACKRKTEILFSTFSSKEAWVEVMSSLLLLTTSIAFYKILSVSPDLPCQSISHVSLMWWVQYFRREKMLTLVFLVWIFVHKLSMIQGLPNEGCTILNTSLNP